jgi:hypothetical protein
MNRIKNSLIAFTCLLVFIGVAAMFTSHAGYSRTVSAGAGAPAPPPGQGVVVTNTPLPVTGQVGITGKPSVIVANPVSIDSVNNTVTLDPNSALQVHEPETILASDQTVTINFPQYVGQIDVSAFKQIRVVLHYVAGTTNYSVQPVITIPDSVSTIPLGTNPILPGQGTVTRVYTPLCQNIRFAVSPNPPAELTLRILVYGREN